MKPRFVIPLISALLVLATAGQYLLRANESRSEGGPASGRADGADGAGARAAGVVAKQTRAIPPHREEGGAPKVAAGVLDYHGQAVALDCATCHATREPNLDNGVEGRKPTEFHQGLVYAHGGRSCLSCHAADDYDSLRLADGRKLAFAQGQMLCAQCHGPQARDYLNGSHGGMNGHWDQTKGGRTRRTCTDCHDVHAPAYPLLQPVFAPIDAAARQQAEREAKHSSGPGADIHHE
jgi:hypothetical protein